MNVFDRNINFDALFKFSQISHSTQVHLKNVYSSLAVCMFVAAAGSYVHVVTRLFQGGVLSALISLGMMFWLAMTPHNYETEKKRLAILAGFAFFTGVGLGPTMDFVIAVNPSIIVTAFMGTSVIFVCFTLSALYAKRRSYLFLGGTLMSGLSLLFLMSIMNMFFGSVMLFKAAHVPRAAHHVRLRPVRHSAHHRESRERRQGLRLALRRPVPGLHHHLQETDGHPRHER
ncbi:putative Bax inhibitor 1 [Larimichthys crocea]|uniref:Uncharacterized protein n=1 Tax=Larimichthys crocea TaxID=215358 RepID=A0ACD3RAH1_LARCR|nr:putative Bax inhibitor 1 [Larimichthys crocea]